MEKIKVFEGDDYESLEMRINNWIYQTGYIIVNTSISTYMAGYTIYYCISVLYKTRG